MLPASRAAVIRSRYGSQAPPDRYRGADPRRCQSANGRLAAFGPAPKSGNS